MKNSLLFPLFGLILMLSGCVQKTEQKMIDNYSLPRSTPEAEGLSSEAVIQFIDAAESVRDSSIELHSFMIVRHGKVLAEGWWSPYRRGLRHTMYSVSKSFTSTAIGLAVAEGRLKLTDKVVSFFPESLPDTVSPYLAQLDVDDLLKMSVGQAREPQEMRFSDDWIKTFLAAPVQYEPGTVFLYNSAGSFMLSAILQKATGERLIDYLTPRLFEPLGIKDADWEVNPQGINVGGWGLRVKTEDMAKLGLLYLQKGKWRDHRILTEEWVNAATSEQIKTVTGEEDPANDWAQGYGYQFWQTRNNAFRGDGAFGQFIIVLPEKDAVIVLTANAQDMQKEINLVWKHIFPAFRESALAEDSDALDRLKSRLSALRLPVHTTRTSSPVREIISGKTMAFNKNPLKISELTLRFEGDVCRMTLRQDTATYEFRFSSTSWEEGETLRHGPSLTAGSKAGLTGLPPFKVAGNYAWKDEKTLELVLRYMESPNDERFLFSFEKPAVSVEYSTGYDFYQQKLRWTEK